MFPQALVEPCIKAGTSERGVCSECGAPWERVVERTEPTYSSERASHDFAGRKVAANANYTSVSHGLPGNSGVGYRKVATTGWRPSCTHDAPTVPATVLDPFAGSGTVGLVAQRLSRRAVLIDLNPDYLKQQLERNAQTPLGLEAA